MNVEDCDKPELKQPPFDVAPALYAYNVPRYYTILLRAREYAKANNLQLSWCLARDIPLHRDDRDLPPEQLDAKRCRWLGQHDQNTSHIASQTALAKGLPFRLTDAVDRGRGLFRGRRGIMVGWAPHPEEERIDVDGEWFLTKMPFVIYGHFPGATWTVHEDLGVGVYPLTPVSRTWKPGRNASTRIRRTGFFLVPDFASTAHMIQGQSLDAAFADVVHSEFTETITEELQVAAYTMLSRAKFLSKIWIMQAFSIQLFSRGPPTGPRLLLKKLKGELQHDAVGEEFQKAATLAEQQAQAKDALKALYRCTQCFLSKKEPFMKPAAAFGVHSPQDVLLGIVAEGAWARCLECQTIANARREKPVYNKIAPVDGGMRLCKTCGKWIAEEAFRQKNYVC